MSTPFEDLPFGFGFQRSQTLPYGNTFLLFGGEFYRRKDSVFNEVVPFNHIYKMDPDTYRWIKTGEISVERSWGLAIPLEEGCEEAV